MIGTTSWIQVMNLQTKYDHQQIIIIKTTMNTIKFLPNNNILLNNKTLLTKINNTNKYTTWYTIKNKNYVELQSLPIN